MKRSITSLMAAALLSTFGTAPAMPARREEDPYAKMAKTVYKTKKKNGEPRKFSASPLLASPYGKKKSTFNRSTKGSVNCKAKRK